MDSSNVAPSAGKIWAVLAAQGKSGKSNSAVCVAVIVSWFRSLTYMPFVVLVLFLIGAVVERKCLVQPVSTIS